MPVMVKRCGVFMGQSPDEPGAGMDERVKPMGDSKQIPALHAGLYLAGAVCGGIVLMY
jgi:hypothetical protein